MDVGHDDKDLEALEHDPEHKSGFDRSLVRQFRKVMNLVRRVQHETELYAWKGLRFKKLSGNRAHQRSLRLNDQWRLIVEIEDGGPGHTCVVKGIEDYH